MSRRDEHAVGIIAFTNTCRGFTGILKQRYSDFIVREIDQNGEIARLTNINGKEYEDSVFPSNNNNSTESADVGTSITNFISGLKEMVELSEERENEISIFLQSVCDKSDDCPPHFPLAPCPSKELRTTMHQLIKRYFQQFIESDTMTIDDVQWIRLLAKHKPVKGAKKWRPQWPPTLPNHLKFKILKENIDTMSAVHWISKQLRIKPETIKFAGTKDKRAVTVQWATGYRLKPSNLCRLNNSKFPFIRVGDFSYVSDSLVLGNLSGNRFEIVLREVQSDPLIIQEACEGLKSTGYINYFGLQRFGRGGSESGSHLIGLQLFKSNWKGSLDLMFKPLVGDRPEIHQAKLAYERKDYKTAKQLLPTSMYSEIKALERLATDPCDFHGAYHAIPHTTQLICVHAFQSYIFNLAATHRIQHYGRQLVVGDLVTLSNLIDQATPDADADEDEAAIDAISETIIKEIVDDNPQQQRDLHSEINIHVVTEEDISANRYTIHDVILPLIGKNTILPENQTGEYIKSLLHDNGLSLDFFRNPEKVGIKCRIRGHYRRVLEYPREFTYRLVNYTDPNETIQQTEINTLHLQQSSQQEQQVDEEDKESTSTLPTQTRQAVVIEFNLSSGSYATMLLRELMKEVTDTSYHAELTAATVPLASSSSSSASSSSLSASSSSNNTILEKRKSEEQEGNGSGGGDGDGSEDMMAMKKRTLEDGI